VLGIATHAEKSSAYARLTQQRNALYLHLDPAGGAMLSGRGLFDRDALTALVSRAAQSSGARIGRLLGEMHVTAGSNAMVTVAPAFRAYWTLTKRCDAAPFLIPSFFGLPLLKGLPPSSEACDLGDYYGFGLYGTSSQAADINGSNLCRLARQKGFSTLVLLRSEQGATKLECTGSDEPVAGVIP
jgi:hypothetical protein